MPLPHGDLPPVEDLLPEGYVLLEVAASMKVLNERGDVELVNYRSAGLAAWEALGMLTVHADGIRDAMQQPEGEL